MSSLALFQSMSQMLRVTDQVSRASDAVVESFLERSVLTTVISGVVAPWPEAKSQAFLGAPKSFEGLSTGSPEFGVSNIGMFTIALEKQQEGLFLLRYGNGDSQWELARYSANDPEFRYLTDTNVWISVWPPEKRSAKTREVSEFDIPQILPISVKLMDNKQTIWIKSISRSQNLPFRVEGDFDDF